MPKLKPKTLTSSEGKATGKQSDTAAPRVPKKDKEFDTIRQFLAGCSTFEAETIRIIVSIVGAENGIKTLSTTDEFTLNCYLNVGFKKNVDSCSDALIAHRQSRVVPVANLASPYLDKEQILPTVGMLFQIASNEKSITTFLKRTKGTPLAALPDNTQTNNKPKRSDKPSDTESADETMPSETTDGPSLFDDGVALNSAES